MTLSTLIARASHRTYRTHESYMQFRVAAMVLCGAASIAAEPLGTVVHETGMQPPRHGGVYVVAHRGAHEGIPENTLAAYRKEIGRAHV